jgi:hypothetical protein
MTKRSMAQRKVQRRLLRSRTRPKARRSRLELMQWPISSSSQTRPSSFFRITTEGGFEEYRTRDSTGSSLVSFVTHAQLEEEDPMDEGTEVEGGCD